jgi:hypothetical protein
MAISIQTGLAIFVTLVAFFFVMQALDLSKHLALRAFNLAFLAGGILIALNRFANKLGGKMVYFSGMRIGLLVSAAVAVLFGAFIGLYLGMNPAFMAYLVQHLEIGPYLTPPSAAVAVGIEAFSTGVIFTFVVMPYFKRQ